MRVVHAGGLEGARSARDTVVVIDVLRAFTVSAYALAGGAAECRLVAEVEEARSLAARLPGAIVSAEMEGLSVAGIVISNSPTVICDLGLRAEVMAHSRTSGT